MSEKMKALEKFKKDVSYRLRSIAGKNGIVKMYQKLALKLSKLAKKTPAWSWRYVQGVYHGTIEPGKIFLLAVERYVSKKELPPAASQEWWERVVKMGTRIMVRNHKREVASVIKSHVEKV